MKIKNQKIQNAWEKGIAAKCGSIRTDGTDVWLHDNKIIQTHGEVIFACLAGWNTPTTRTALNDILSNCWGLSGNAPRFTQKDFTPFYNGEQISSTEWVKIN
jgi:hypothetical protein